MIVDGRNISKEILAQLSEKRSAFAPVMRLGVLMGGGDAATESYVRIKEKVADQLQVVVVRELIQPEDSLEKVQRSLERLSRTCEGVVIQLPLPAHISVDALLKLLPPEKDIDALNTETAHVHAPVAAAALEILRRFNVEIAGKKAVVVGEGQLVGKPCAQMLRERGAIVSVVSLEKGSLEELIDADIVVSGAGSPNLIQPEMLKKGCALIDAGTSEQGGKLAGDASPACAEVAGVFTPVPGGVGPVAVTMLFKNLFDLAETS